jgi:hypothetical protein
MAEDRRAKLTRLVADEMRRLAPEGGVGVAVERRTGGNAGWSVTVRLGAVGVSSLIVGSDEDPYAVPDGLFVVVARDLLADARKRAAKAEAIRERRNRENHS